MDALGLGAPSQPIFTHTVRDIMSAFNDIDARFGSSLRLLALDQQARLHELPGGNASPVTLQNGNYRYDIAGS